MKNYIIKTKRLGLRNWFDSDVEMALKMNADKSVMEFFPDTWSLQETESFIKRMQRHFKKHGFCYFAADHLESDQFIGFVGLSHQTFKSDFTPCVDIGWRLLPDVWGQGFATEGAKGCLDYAFNTLNLPNIFAIAPELNLKSQKVMLKLGMTKHLHFVHPNLELESPLKYCVSFQITKVDFLKNLP